MSLWLERRQVPLYLLALGMAAVVGLLAPATAPVWEGAITSVLGALLTVTFLAVPFRALLVGVLRVLLTPCVDYVIVFTRLAGGASDRLLALLAERVVAVLRACRRGRRDADARRAARNGGLRARDPVACPFGMNAAGE